jgi:hypothetical protein
MPDQYHTKEEESITTLPHTRRPRTDPAPPFPGRHGREQAKLAAPSRNHCRCNYADHSCPPAHQTPSSLLTRACCRRRYRPRRPWQPPPSPSSDPPHTTTRPHHEPSDPTGTTPDPVAIATAAAGGRPAPTSLLRGARTSHPPRSAGEEGEGHAAAFPTGPGGPLQRWRGRREHEGGAAVAAANPSRPRRPARVGRMCFFKYTDIKGKITHLFVI